LQSLPQAAQDAAGTSLGAAVGISEKIGDTGTFIALNARRSFMDGYDAAFRLSVVFLLATLFLVFYLVGKMPNRGRPAPMGGPPGRPAVASVPIIDTLVAESPIGGARAGVSPTVRAAEARARSRDEDQHLNLLRTSVAGETRFQWIPTDVAGTHRERHQQRRGEHEPVRSERSQSADATARVSTGAGLDRAFVEAALPAYELGVELGQGSWGVVVTARHKRLDRVVAIKTLPPAFAANDEVRGRFAAEAKLLAGFDDPHIVPIFDFVEEPQGCLLVMEYMPGGNVWTRFSNDGLTFEASVAIAISTALALHYSHSRGVLHRDIKPDNLLFSSTGAVKVTDFGLAKVLGGAATMMTRAGQVLGTPAYIAPEQALGEALTPATDVYSVGSMLFELLSGDLPFPDDGNPVKQLLSHISDEPRVLHEFAPDVPDALADPVMRAISRDAGLRQDSAWELAAELATVARDLWGPNWVDEGGIPLELPDRLTSGATPEAPAAVLPPAAQPVVGQSSEPRRSSRMSAAGSPNLSVNLVEPANEITMADLLPVDQALTSENPPAWHPDPWHIAQWRWWDGETWTHHTA